MAPLAKSMLRIYCLFQQQLFPIIKNKEIEMEKS